LRDRQPHFLNFWELIGSTTCNLCPELVHLEANCGKKVVSAVVSEFISQRRIEYRVFQYVLGFVCKP
jgi:hypothetical protein